ncbi:hypothetical protein HUT18_21955 [Streptomyces sp. NA04227]|uniref:hypothetical protein n=1 Tax=Streptomyces sp. NA04227 TaxID=2742136 RepID=UPI00159147B1|nr:hypothetical protein [Streptomyces sp. NA04227]QKW08642.1 hypothetical protein HUT18_21955 [Streptomyces sp. NA04227]
MSAPERKARPEHKTPSSMPPVPSGLSMSELLKSCAAADAVSTPPRDPDPERGPASGATRHGEQSSDHQSPDRESPDHRSGGREAA